MTRSENPANKEQDDKVYAAYAAALERLRGQREPGVRLESAELREMLENRGHVPITQDNVAREAGLTRKALVSGGRFEELGTQIKQLRPTLGVKPSTTEQISRLKTQVAEADQAVIVLKSKMAVLIIKANKVITDLNSERKETARLKEHIATLDKSKRLENQN